MPWRDTDKGRLHGETFEPDHERGIGIVPSSHTGIPARRMSVGKGKKVRNNTDVQGIANNFAILDSEDNGSRVVADKDHTMKALHK